MEEQYKYQIPVNIDAEEEELWPIRFQGKFYYQEDVDERFRYLYQSKSDLNPDNSISIIFGKLIYPNGKII